MYDSIRNLRLKMLRIGFAMGLWKSSKAFSGKEKKFTFFSTYAVTRPQKLATEISQTMS